MAVSTSRVLLYALLVRQLVTVSTCSSGFFLGENRTCIACPEHCLDCDSDEYCLYCKKGYWGMKCELSCSNCMAETSCEKTNGFCKEGCANGYSGLLCNVKCDNKCTSCTRENSKNCSECATGRYPVSNCDKNCSGCYEQNCDEAGICALRCVDGFWGQRCEEMCSQNCMYASCDRDNGTCIARCNDNSAGLQCNKTTNSTVTDKNSMPVIPVVVAAAVGAIVIVVIICFVFCLRRRRQKSRQDPQPEVEDLLEANTAVDQENDGAPRSTDKCLEAGGFTYHKETPSKPTITGTRFKVAIAEKSKDHFHTPLENTEKGFAKITKTCAGKKLQPIRTYLQKDEVCRVIHETGVNLFVCLSSCIGSLIALDDSSGSTDEMKTFVSAETLQENVVTLLKTHANSWRAMLRLLVDDFPLPETQLDERDKEKYLKQIDELYTKIMTECSKGDYSQNYTKLCLYASATCINTPIYVISFDQQWYYFEPLFSFSKQPKTILRYITMCVCPEYLFYKVESTARNAPPPKATGLVGMYMKCLEDTPTLRISVPDELRNIPKSTKTDVCNGVGEEIIKECCDLLLETERINKKDHTKLTRRDRLADFCTKIADSEDAFETLCKVLIKRRKKCILSSYIKNLSLFVQSCEYLSQYEALTMLDCAIVERNVSVKSFVAACSPGEKELNETNKEVTASVITTSSIGIFASGSLVIASLLLAPFSFGASLGLGVAGGVLGVGTGVKAGTARVVDALKEKEKLNDVEKMQMKLHEKEEKVSTETEHVEQLFKTTLNKGNESSEESPVLTKSKCLAVGSAVRIVSHSASSIATDVGRTGSTTVPAANLGPLSLVIDIEFLAKAAHNKRKGDETDAGEMLQNITEIVESKCKIFNNMLRGDFEDGKRMFESFLV